MINKHSTMWSWAKRPIIAMALVAFAAVGFAPAAMAFGNSSKILIVDNDDTASFTTLPYSARTGSWSTVYFDNASSASTLLNGPPYGESVERTLSVTGAATHTHTWYTGTLTVGPGGPFTVEAYVPDDTVGGATVTYYVDRGSSTDCASGTWTNIGSTSVNQNANDGKWVPLGAFTFDQSVCYRVTMSNLSSSAGLYVWADAVRIQRGYEHKLTIPDMPKVFSANNAGAITITGTSGGTATDIRTLTVTCPADGTVLVNGSGESVAKSNAVGYMGIAYSIAKNTAVADITTVIQSSAQSEYNGDENRDFLSIQRFDSCTKGQSITYHLVGYLAQPQTTTASYIWNARLSAIYTP